MGGSETQQAGDGVRRATTAVLAVALLGAVAALVLSQVDIGADGRPDAELAVSARNVDVRPATGSAPAPGVDGQELAIGSEVITDPAGRAQVAYGDGSLTRLDHDTVFRVVDLTRDGGGRQTVTRLDVGRTWHRVERLSESSSYVVETPVATAAVRGTTFVVSCTPEPVVCTFIVIEGVVRVTPTAGAVAEDRAAGEPVTLRAGQLLVVRADGVVGGAQDVDIPVLALDPFVAENLGADGREVREPTAEERNRSARIEGDWAVTVTVVSADENTERRPGQRAWRFDPACPSGPCAVMVHREARTVDGPVSVQALVVPEAGVYRMQHDVPAGRCTGDDGSVVEAIATATIEFRVVDTEIRGHEVIATVLEGTADETYRWSRPGVSGCDYVYAPSRITLRGTPGAPAVAPAAAEPPPASPPTTAGYQGGVS